MKRRRNRAALVCAVVALVLSAPPARAQLPEAPMGKWWKRPRVVEALKLTPEQQERLEGIFAKNRRSFIDLKADVERRHLDLEELLARKDSDPKKVSAAVDAHEQARLRLRKAFAMMVLEMREILTGEQWQMFLERGEDARRDRDERRLGARRGMFRDRGPRDGAPQRGGAPAPDRPPEREPNKE